MELRELLPTLWRRRPVLRHRLSVATPAVCLLPVHLRRCYRIALLLRHAVAHLGHLGRAATEPASAEPGRTRSSAAVATPWASVGGLVDADGPAVKSATRNTGQDTKYAIGLALSAHSMLFIAVMAFCASSSLVYRTKPNPRLRPVSRSLTTTFCFDLPRQTTLHAFAEGTGRLLHTTHKGSLTASSTTPNSSNFWRRVPSSVCQASPLGKRSATILRTRGLSSLS